MWLIYLYIYYIINNDVFKSQIVLVVSNAFWQRRATFGNPLVLHMAFYPSKNVKDPSQGFEPHLRFFITNLYKIIRANKVYVMYLQTTSLIYY